MSSQGSQTQPTGDREFSERTFNTDALPERQRLSFWRQEFGQTLVRVEIEPLHNETVRARATLRSLPGLRMLSFNGSAMRFNRTASMAASGDDSIGLVVSLDPSTTLSQHGRELSLAFGDAACVLTDDPGMVAGCGHLGLLFPRAPLASRIKNIAEHAAKAIPHETGALQLLSAYLNALPRKLKFDSGRLERAVIEHIYDLTAQVICPDRSPDENSLSATAAARLELALAYVNRHFDLPGLSVEEVAREQNISPRYLQRLIETKGSTFSERVIELRLQRAHALLNDARHAGLRIADIAVRAGFSDVSHFNRVFRRRFGETPGNVRSNVRREWVRRPVK